MFHSGGMGCGTGCLTRMFGFEGCKGDGMDVSVGVLRDVVFCPRFVRGLLWEAVDGYVPWVDGDGDGLRRGCCFVC